MARAGLVIMVIVCLHLMKILQMLMIRVCFSSSQWSPFFLTELNESYTPLLKILQCSVTSKRAP